MNPPQSLKLERALLAAVLFSDQIVDPLVSVEHIRPDHFYRPAHSRLFETVLALRDDGERADTITVEERLVGPDAETDRQALHTLVGSDFAVTSWRTYARELRQVASARKRWTAARALIEACESGDEQAMADAEGRLADSHEANARRPTAETRYEAAFAHSEHPEERTWPWPFRELTLYNAGGLRPGQFTIVAGWTSHGKSVWLDQTLELAGKSGAKVVLYINEMAVLERDLRHIARRADIPFSRVLCADFGSDEERRRYLKVAESFPFEIVPAAGWSAQEIAYDIRRTRPDIAGVDLLNGIPHQEVRDIDQNVRTLTAAAKQADCHILACQHLNQLRSTSTYPPQPVIRDIRGSGQIADLADNVLFVYRRQSDDGDPGDEATLAFGKVRNGMLGRMGVRFNGSRMRFELPAVPGTVGSIAA